MINIKVLTSGPVTVVEGGSPKCIDVMSTFPPRDICGTGEDCEIEIEALIEGNSDDHQCLGQNIQQVKIFLLCIKLFPCQM